MFDKLDDGFYVFLVQIYDLIIKKTIDIKIPQTCSHNFMTRMQAAQNKVNLNINITLQ